MLNLFFSAWPTMQWQDRSLSCFSPDFCCPQLAEDLSACSPLMALRVTVSLSSCSSQRSPPPQLSPNLLSQPPWPPRALYLHQTLALPVPPQGLCFPLALRPFGEPALPPTQPFTTVGICCCHCELQGSPTAMARHSHGQEEPSHPLPSLLHHWVAAPAVFSSPSLLKAEREGQEKRGEPKSPCTFSWVALPGSCTHVGRCCSMQEHYSRQQRAPTWVAWWAHRIHQHPSPQPHAHRPPQARVKHLPWLRP